MEDMDLDLIFGDGGNDIDNVDFAEFCETAQARHFNRGFDLVFDEKDRFSYLA